VRPVDEDLPSIDGVLLDSALDQFRVPKMLQLVLHFNSSMQERLRLGIQKQFLRCVNTRPYFFLLMPVQELLIWALVPYISMWNRIPTYSSIAPCANASAR
jgi:hypothetical protein